MKCEIPLNCPKGLTRSELVDRAKACNIVGSTNNYKSPYRNMKWLCSAIEESVKKFEGMPGQMIPKPVVIPHVPPQPLKKTPVFSPIISKKTSVMKFPVRKKEVSPKPNEITDIMIIN